jgi:hypothetical protein
MSRIAVPVTAYILALFPQSSPSRRTGSGQALLALSSGLAVPSFWTRAEIRQTFVEANQIWTREADIEFAPIDVVERDEVVPAFETPMWIHFINHLRPVKKRGVAVGFVHDLPSDEGGWGGGRIAVISGVKARSGLRGFGGNLLAHELGHVLMDDPNHTLAAGDPSNLMSATRNPRVANAGMLNQQQIAIARSRAATL